jgi:hypothetical protein
MREDYQESLDKMFPAGYVILYTCPNETLRIAKYNPKKLFQIQFAEDILIENWKKEDNQ